MSTPHRIATLRLTHEELDFVLAALNDVEFSGEFSNQRRLIAAIRGEIQHARQRETTPGESGPVTDTD